MYESLQGPYILSHLYNYLLLGKDRIFSTKDRIFSAEDRIFSVRTVYFQARTVYFPAGPYILLEPYIFKDRIFYFTGPYILPYNRKISKKIKKNYLDVKESSLEMRFVKIKSFHGACFMKQIIDEEIDSQSW